MARRDVPRDDSGNRFNGSQTSEVLENDLGNQSSRLSSLERRVGAMRVSITAFGYDIASPTLITGIEIDRGLVGTIVGSTLNLKSRYGAFGEMVLVAMTSSTDELVDTNNREFYVSPYTKFRMVIHETNVNGNDYQVEYLDSGVWTGIGTAYTTHGAEPISYHTPWEDIPAPVLAIEMPILRVKQASVDPDCDVTMCVIQFWDSTTTADGVGTPPSSGETLPSVAEVELPV
jgi:hypothetical protein